MPNSRIVPDVAFAEDESVVFVMNIKGTQHAFILVEDTRRMVRYDYGTKASTTEVLSKSLSGSTTRLISGCSSAQSTCIPGIVDIKNVNIEEFIKYAQDKALQYQYMVVNQTKEQQLFDAVQREHRNPPAYCLNGSTPLFSAGGENCMTWCIRMAKGIDFVVKDHWTMYVIVAKPCAIDKPQCMLL